MGNCNCVDGWTAALFERWMGEQGWWCFRGHWYDWLRWWIDRVRVGNSTALHWLQTTPLSLQLALTMKRQRRINICCENNPSQIGWREYSVLLLQYYSVKWVAEKESTGKEVNGRSCPLKGCEQIYILRDRFYFGANSPWIEATPTN